MIKIENSVAMQRYLTTNKGMIYQDLGESFQLEEILPNFFQWTGRLFLQGRENVEQPTNRIEAST